MAGRYSKEELKQMLHRGAFELVATDGIERITGRKVAVGAGLSEPYIYQCYSDMTELLTDAFMHIDAEVADLTSMVIQQDDATHCKLNELEPICYRMWQEYWSFLMEDPARTVFYWRFYQSAYYTKELLAQRQQNFQPFNDFVHGIAQELAFDVKIDLEAVVSNIIDGTTSDAVKIHLGYMENDAIPPQMLYYSVFSLLYSIIGIEINPGLS